MEVGVGGRGGQMEARETHGVGKEEVIERVCA